MEAEGDGVAGRADGFPSVRRADGAGGVLDDREPVPPRDLVERVVVGGKADLVNEILDFRVEPKFVATIKGQGDTEDRSGIMVPVLVTGSFSSPKFRPDLEGMVKDQLKNGIPDASELEKVIKG